MFKKTEQMFCLVLIYVIICDTIKGKLYGKAVIITGKLDRLIDDIERAAANEKSVLSKKEYTDTPLLFTASQMRSFTPDRIARFRREFRTRSVYTADPKQFLLQARSMEDYEEDYTEKVDFSSAFPSYAAMNDGQLRTYFAWRKKIRNGIPEKTSLSYAYVYIFELLNIVGAENPVDAYEKLRDFFDFYGSIDGSVLLYRERWLTDFAVYYGLERFYAELPSEDTLSKSGAVLQNPVMYGDDEVFAAVEEFSSYSLMHSAVNKKAPELCKRAAAKVVREMDAHLSLSGGFAEHYCKKRKAMYFMFASAIVFTDMTHSDRLVELPDGRMFCCINGHWLKSVFVRDSLLSRDLGALLRTVDISLRNKLKIKNKIKPSPLNTKICTLIDECVDEVCGEIRREQKQKRMESIKIDFSHIDSIRRASDETGEKLMTYEDTDTRSFESSHADEIRYDDTFSVSSEESEGNNPETPTESSVFAVPRKEDETAEPGKKSPSEKENTYGGDIVSRVLTLLLDGQDPSAEVRKAGTTLSMVCDAANERFFDVFSDTVIDFEGEQPFVIPDYTDELRGMLE